MNILTTPAHIHVVTFSCYFPFTRNINISFFDILNPDLETVLTALHPSVNWLIALQMWKKTSLISPMVRHLPFMVRMISLCCTAAGCHIFPLALSPAHCLLLQTSERIWEAITQSTTEQEPITKAREAFLPKQTIIGSSHVFVLFFCYYLTGLTFISNLCSGQLSGSLKAACLLICV